MYGESACLWTAASYLAQAGPDLPISTLLLPRAGVTDMHPPCLVWSYFQYKDCEDSDGWSCVDDFRVIKYTTEPNSSSTLSGRTKCLRPLSVVSASTCSSRSSDDFDSEECKWLKCGGKPSLGASPRVWGRKGLSAESPRHWRHWTLQLWSWPELHPGAYLSMLVKYLHWTL